MYRRLIGTAMSLLFIFTGCAKTSNAAPEVTRSAMTTPSASFQSEPSPSSAQTIVYKNTDYGFDFELPESWGGYTIVTDTWKGTAQDKNQEEKTVQTGPIIYIRHPLWTEADPRQDIPIIVFTIAQWDSLQEDIYHIGAAPVGPTELGQNSVYVFALPARYNYSFLTGYEEVQDILDGNPLKPTEDILKS